MRNPTNTNQPENDIPTKEKTDTKLIPNGYHKIRIFNIFRFYFFRSLIHRTWLSVDTFFAEVFMVIQLIKANKF